MENGILQEAQEVKLVNGKAIFTMVFQSADDLNQNKRMYPKTVLDDGIRNCFDRMKNRSFLGELDHPLPQGSGFDEVRQTTVMLSDVSHLISSYEWRGNLLYGEMETLDTPKGQILYSLVKDKVGLGVSMRGLAELERKDSYNLVKGPLFIVCYDAVSRPSHSQSKVDAKHVRFESLTESSNGLVCVNGQCYLPNYFDKLVEQKMVKFFKKW